MTTRDRPTAPGTGAGAVRVAVGVGAPQREREILAELDGCPGVVAERCLSADQILDSVRAGRADAALVSTALHRFDDTIVDALLGLRTPIVLLVPPDEAARWDGTGVTILAADAAASAVRDTVAVLPVHAHYPTSRYGATIAASGRDGAAGRAAPAPETSETPSDEAGDAGASQDRDGATVIAVAGGHGSPGRTTIAAGLAAALGAVAPTILVDGDTSAPAVAAVLDADPTRNLRMLAYADLRGPGAWERAIRDEVQPIGPRSPHGSVLCGIPRPEARGDVSGAFFDRLLAELHQRFRFVVLDTGADLLGDGAEVHRLAIARADHVLVVASADIVGLMHARRTVGALRAQLCLPADRMALVLNRHDGRFHHGRAEVEWALDLPAAAVVPHDQAGVQAALAARRPVVLAARSRAGGAVLDLAERICRGSIALPAEPPPHGRGMWSRLAAHLHGAGRRAAHGAPEVAAFPPRLRPLSGANGGASHPVRTPVAISTPVNDAPPVALPRGEGEVSGQPAAAA